MPNSRFDHAEIARSALNDMPEGARAAFMAEMLTELRGPQAIEHLSKVRAAVSLRMQEIIDARYPLHELAEVYGDAAAVRARLICINPATSGVLPEVAPAKDPMSASIPWEGVNSPERAAAFLEEASAEDIDLMAISVLEARDIPPEWQLVRSHIMSAVSSSAKLFRRMISARTEAQSKKYRWRQREPLQGNRS